MSRKTILFVFVVLFLVGFHRSTIDVTRAQDAKATDQAKKSIEKLLVRCRAAAAKADGKEYFACFDTEGIFFGTDPTERFTFPELKAFLGPYFEKGTGWKREVSDRHVYVGSNNQIGWFEEKSKRLDVTMRTTGVVRKTAKGWKIVQYNTSITVPNEIYPQIEELVREADKSKGDGKKNVRR